MDTFVVSSLLIGDGKQPRLPIDMPLLHLASARHASALTSVLTQLSSRPCTPSTPIKALLRGRRPCPGLSNAAIHEETRLTHLLLLKGPDRSRSEKHGTPIKADAA